MDSQFDQPLQQAQPPQPQPPMAMPQKKSKKPLVFGILGVVLLLALVAGGVYYWQQQKIDKLEAEVASLNAKVTELEKKATATSEVVVETDNTTDQVTVTIKELGITLTGPATLGDLTYSYRTSTTDDGKTVQIADLSSKSLTSFDANCAATGSAPPLGYISKVSGQYPASPTATNASGTLYKQFPTYYIGGYLNAQAACSEKDYPADLVAKTTTLRNDLSTALKSVTAQ